MVDRFSQVCFLPHLLRLVYLDHYLFYLLSCYLCYICLIKMLFIPMLLELFRIVDGYLDPLKIVYVLRIWHGCDNIFRESEQLRFILALFVELWRPMPIGYHSFGTHTTLLPLANRSASTRCWFSFVQNYCGSRRLEQALGVWSCRFPSSCCLG